MERLVLRALDHVSSWCASDAAALQQLSAASNVLWRASLLARAAEPDGARLLGALPPFPRLAPRLLRAHVGVALSLLAGLAPSCGAVGELQVAAERLAGVAGEAAGGSGGGGAAGVLMGLRQAVAGATGARLQACLDAASVRAALLERDAAHEGDEPSPAAEALAAAAARLRALAREWEAGALPGALSAREAGGLRALEGAVWAATGGARSLRAALEV
jgi:hypothetical protein